MFALSPPSPPIPTVPALPPIPPLMLIFRTTLCSLLFELLLTYFGTVLCIPVEDMETPIGRPT